MTDELAAARLAICDLGRAVWQRSLVAANDGNLSVRVGDRVVCTPTGVSKGFLHPEDLAVVALDGRVLSEHQRPSSEIKMHLRVYEVAEDITAVVHAHPMFATMMAIQGRSLECRMLPETIVTMPTVPLAPYATPSTDAVPDSITAIIPQTRACLLEQHGALTWGADLMTAYLAMERLEYTAEMIWRLDAVGGGRDLAEAEVERLRQLFNVR